MKNRLVIFETTLKKLNSINDNKFSSVDFKSINKDLETQLNDFNEQLEFDKKTNITFDDQLQIKTIILNIEKLEAKVLPKAELINSFSQSSV
jgi:hypothetical protein